MTKFDQIVNNIMRYGIWSGRGWSNGWNSRMRYLTDAEKGKHGIDAHDNYFAKSHDLNEFHAEQKLREHLASAGFQELDALQDAKKWRQKLAVKSDRILDFNYYYSRASEANKQKVADAFVMYWDHFMRSNMQFALDFGANGVDAERHGLAAMGMAMQRMAAPHVFLQEAAAAGERIKNIKRLASADIDRRTGAYLRENFVSPEFDNAPSKFIGSNGTHKFTRSVPVDRILRAPREDLLGTYRDLERKSQRVWDEDVNDDDNHSALPPSKGRGDLPSVRTPATRPSPKRKPAPRDRLGATPVAVVVPDESKPDGRNVVTMRADTPVKNRNGDWSTIQQAMATEGLDLDPAWGAFRAPGARDRDLQWYDWADSGRGYDSKLALKAPVRWVLPPRGTSGTPASKRSQLA